MKRLNKSKGDIGEAIAFQYLKKQGYKILEINYKNKIGEIDIIAEKNNIIRFVEVKERASDKFGQPSEAVDKHKQYKIAKVAQYYLIKNKKNASAVSFDVLEILDGKLNLIENAFEV